MAGKPQRLITIGFIGCAKRPHCSDARAAGLRNHAVIVGYGRVGSVVGHALVIASPDGFQVRRTLELARERNPRIAIVVRTHTANELALEITDYALRSLGVSEERSKMVTQWLRTQEISRPK